jgi:hypothetical protein
MALRAAISLEYISVSDTSVPGRDTVTNFLQEKVKKMQRWSNMAFVLFINFIAG